MSRHREIAGALLASALCAASCGGDSPAHRDEHETERPGAGAEIVTISARTAELADVRTGRVERRALGGGASIPAEVRSPPTSTAHVGPLVPGRVVALHVELGDAVERGRELAVVASTSVAELRASLAAARARLTAAEDAVTRQRALVPDSVVARRALVDAEADAAALRAEVRGQEEQLTLLGAHGRGEFTLRAPIEGIVVSLHGTIGEFVSPDEPIFVITDPSRVTVHGDVPELSVADAVVGSPAVVRLHAYPDAALRGRVTYVAPALEERTRSLPVVVRLDEPDARLRSGLFGSIELAGPGDDRPLVVPTSAVVTYGGRTVVFVTDGAPTRFRVRDVALGRRAGGYQAVRSGLAENEEYAVSGAFTLLSVLRAGEMPEGHED